MTSPHLRLFAVFWRLLVTISTGFALIVSYYLWITHYKVLGLIVILAVLALPFVVMTTIRWITAGRWRFGPRW